MKPKTLPINPVADEPESLGYRIGTACLSAFVTAAFGFAWCALAAWEFAVAVFNTLVLGKDAAQQLRDMEDDA